MATKRKDLLKKILNNIVSYHAIYEKVNEPKARFRPYNLFTTAYKPD